MAEAAVSLDRLGPLSGRQAVSITAAPPAARFSFRGGPAAVDRLGPAFGCQPQTTACRAAVAGDRIALWLGPDEWMLIDPEQDTAPLFTTLEAALREVPHSLVDVSHRNVGFELFGSAVPSVLNEGCPLDFDLAAFPVGMCTRTVLAKTDVVLWRVGPDHFRLECWRSFAPYVLAFLNQAAANQR